MTDVFPSQPADNKTEVSSLDKSTQAFNEQLEKRREQLLERLEKLRSEKISPGNPQLEERANSVMQSIIQKQIAEIDRLKTEAEERFKAEAQSGSQSLDALADEILKDVTEKGSDKIESFEATVNRLVKDKFVVSSEVYDIAQALEGMKKIETDKPELHTAFQKLQDNKELSDDDYKAIIENLHPYNVEQQRHDSTQSFEATGAGVCLRFMRPDQRYKLVEMFMDPKVNPERYKDGIQLLEALLSTGHLNRLQGDELFQKAVKAGLLTQDEYEKTYKPKLESGGEYEQKSQELKKIIDEELQKGYYGQYADNIMNRVVGKPAVGALMTAWGFILVLLNVLANKQDLKGLAKNPYFYMGLAGMGLGVEMATGTMKKGASTHLFGTVGGGVLSHAYNSLDDETNAERDKKMGRKKLEELYPSMNPFVISYLKQPLGGFETLIKLRQEKEAKNLEGEKLMITLDDLMEAEKSTEAAKELENIQALKPSELDASIRQLNQVAEVNTKLDIQSNVEFKRMLDEIESAQRPIAA